MKDATTLSYLIGLSITYRKEESKSMRLASYFNAAFDSPVPQILVSNDGSIIRFNQAAALEFGSPDLRPFKLDSLIGLSVSQARQRTMNGREFVSRKGAKNYAIHAAEAGANMTFLSVRNVTDGETLSWATSLMGPAYGAGVMLLDDKLKILSSTQSMKRIIGYDSSLTISRDIVDLVAEKDRGAFKDVLASVGKNPVIGTVGMATDRGTISIIKFALSKKNDGYMMLFYDSSAERYVDSMRVAFDEFLDSSSDMAFRVDELGYIRYANHAVEPVLGYKRTELIGKEIGMLYSSSDVLEKDLGHARGGTKIDNSYARLKHKDGQPIETNNSIRFFKTGDAAEYVIISKELETKRKFKELNDTIEKQTGTINKLMGQGELKSQFIYNISHELKTPLTNIIRVFQAAQQRGVRDDQRRAAEPHNHDNRGGQQADGYDNPGA